MVSPINTPGGAILTMLFPLGLFGVIAIWLYLRRNVYPAGVAPAVAETEAEPEAQE